MFKLVVSLALVVTASIVFAQAKEGVPPVPTPTPAVSQSDDAAAALKRIEDKMKTHSTVKGTLTISGSGQHLDVKFAMMKPNYVTITSPDFEVHNTGTDTQLYSAKDKMLLTLTADQMKAQGSPTAILIGMNGMLAEDADGGPGLQASGKAKTGFFRGTKALVISLSAPGAGAVLLYVNADTLDPIAFTSPDGKNSGVYSDVVFDAAMKAEEFAWAAPADAKTFPVVPKANGGGG